jgi:tetratricopeptide (TPR) repeat protein
VTTWSLSFQRLQETNPAATDLLRLCTFCAPDSIAEEILTAKPDVLGPVLAPLGTDDLQRDRAIEALRTYSLIRRDPKEKTLSVHRLVQAVLQDGLLEEEQQTWAERAMRAINAAFPQAEHATWPQCERLLIQALKATQLIEEYHFTHWEAGHLLYETASYLEDRARYAEAEPLYQRALHIREQSLGPEHPDVAYPLNGLAILYQEQGKSAEAEPLYQRALRIWEQSLGPEHPHTRQVRKNYAILLRTMERDDEAKRREEEA